MKLLNCLEQVCLNRGCYRFLTALLLIAVISCSPQNPLLGSWEGVEGKNKFAVQKISFAADGTFYFDQIEGTWQINEAEKLTIQFPNVLPNQYTFEVTKNSLILKDQAGIAGEFTRAP